MTLLTLAILLKGNQVSIKEQEDNKRPIIIKSIEHF
jgi:hypothetical protein